MDEGSKSCDRGHSSTGLSTRTSVSTISSRERRYWESSKRNRNLSGNRQDLTNGSLGLQVGSLQIRGLRIRNSSNIDEVNYEYHRFSQFPVGTKDMGK